MARPPPQLIADPGVVDTLAAEPLVVFVGSAISSFAPTSVPTGRDTAEGLVRVILDLLPVPLDQRVLHSAHQRLQAIPFEQVLEACPDHQRLEVLVAESYGVSAPNTMHEALASGVQTGHIRALITTNYDLCFDRLLDDAEDIRRVVTQADAEAEPPGTDGVFFKIHGSADLPPSLVWSLTREARLPHWKRDTLARLARDRTMLVLGYSGGDFEICPELAQLSVRRIVWNIHRNDATAFALRVVEALQGRFVVGDMVELIDSLLGLRSRPDPGRPSHSLVDRVRNAFSHDELRLWGADLFNRVGLPLLAQVFAAESHDWGSQQNLARAWFHSGRYRDAARLQTSLARRAPTRAQKAEMHLEAADALRVYGRPVLATLHVLRAKKALSPGVSTDPLFSFILVKRALVRREFFRIAEMLHLNRLAAWMRNRVLEDLRRAASASYETGQWELVYQSLMLADRIGEHPTDLLGQSEATAMLSSAEGFAHLGYWIAESMALRDAVARRAAVTDAELEQLKDFASFALAQGVFAERWKLARTLAQNRSPDAATFGPAYQAAMARCQYTPSRRLVYRKVGAN